MSQIEPHAPNLASHAPNTIRPTCVCRHAPAHIGHGSKVTINVQSARFHVLDLGVRQRIGVRLAQITATADHRSPSVKHDGTDRYLAFRGGLAGQFNRQLHVVTPLHTRHYTVPLA